MWLYVLFWESVGPGSNLRKCITLFPVLYTVNWLQFAERCVLWSSWCQISWEQCAEGSKSLYRISKLRNVGSYTGCFIAALRVYIEDLWNQVCRVILNIIHGIYFQPEISIFPVWRFPVLGFISSLKSLFQCSVSHIGCLQVRVLTDCLQAWRNCKKSLQYLQCRVLFTKPFTLFCLYYVKD